MGTTFWPSAEDAELVEVDFIDLDGSSHSLKLLADTGFTGASSFVLGEDATGLVRAEYDPAEAVRAWVRCRVPGLAFNAL